MHEAVVRLVLWLLAAYHLAMGGIALLLPSAAPRMVRSLYGAELPAGDAVRYMISMIGALALAIAVVATSAALHPAGHRAGIIALLVLQGGRAICRIRDRRLLATSLGVTPRSNMAATAVLAAEGAVLASWLV